MATASNIKKNITSKNLKKEYGKIHDRVINASEDTVEVTVDNIEKWQKLFAKGVTASTPLVEKGIDITFDVAETIWEQYKSGGKRMRSLLGLEKGDLRLKKRVTKNLNKTVNKVTKSVRVEAKKVVKKAEPVKAKAAVKSVSTKIPTKLTDVNGIGPKIAGLLKDTGIKNIADLAKAEVSTVQKVLDAAGSRFQMHDPSTWVNQAKAIIKG